MSSDTKIQNLKRLAAGGDTDAAAELIALAIRLVDFPALGELANAGYREALDAALDLFAQNLQEKVNAHYARMFPNLKPDRITVELGRRYAKIVKTTDGGAGQRSVHSFVDLKGGKVGHSRTKLGALLKAASWKKPAPRARGSIFDASNGQDGCTAYGAHYMTGGAA